MRPPPIVVVDLGFGDSGKGTITDFLVRKIKATLVVRYSGGPQCGHAVVTPDGKEHAFSQFGSGMLAGAATLLSRHVIIDPLAMRREAEALSRISTLPGIVYVDGRARVATPYHAALNRLLERSRGKLRNGSCGMGVGTTAEDHIKRGADAVFADDLENFDLLVDKLRACRSALAQQAEVAVPLSAGAVRDASIFFCDADDSVLVRIAMDLRNAANQHIRYVNSDRALEMIRTNTCVFEGAQGVLLDENHGFSPYTTWSTVTDTNAVELLNAGGIKDFQTIGVIRTYMTRHGPGPFPSEMLGFMAARKDHNSTGEWQGPLRVGALDLPLLHYAASRVRSLTSIALTHCDGLPSKMPIVRSDVRYTRLLDALDSAKRTDALKAYEPFIEEGCADDISSDIEECLEVPCAIKSYGPQPGNKYVASGCRPLFDVYDKK